MLEAGSIRRYEEGRMKYVRDSEQRMRRMRPAHTERDPANLLGFHIVPVCRIAVSLESVLVILAFFAILIDIMMPDGSGKMRKSQNWRHFVIYSKSDASELIARALVAALLLVTGALSCPVLYVLRPQCVCGSELKARRLMPYIASSPILLLLPFIGRGVCAGANFMCLNGFYVVGVAILVLIRCYCLYLLYKLHKFFVENKVRHSGPGVNEDESRQIQMFDIPEERLTE